MASRPGEGGAEKSRGLCIVRHVRNWMAFFCSIVRFSSMLLIQGEGVDMSEASSRYHALNVPVHVPVHVIQRTSLPVKLLEMKFNKDESIKDVYLMVSVCFPPLFLH